MASVFSKDYLDPILLENDALQTQNTRLKSLSAIDKNIFDKISTEVSQKRNRQNSCFVIIKRPITFLQCLK